MRRAGYLRVTADLIWATIRRETGNRSPPSSAVGAKSGQDTAVDWVGAEGMPRLQGRLPARGRVHGPQPSVHDRRVPARRIHVAVLPQRLRVEEQPGRGCRRPVGLGPLAGVGYQLPTAAAQLQDDPADPLGVPGASTSTIPRSRRWSSTGTRPSRTTSVAWSTRRRRPAARSCSTNGRRAARSTRSARRPTRPRTRGTPAGSPSCCDGCRPPCSCARGGALRDGHPDHRHPAQPLTLRVSARSWICHRRMRRTPLAWRMCGSHRWSSNRPISPTVTPRMRAASTFVIQ
jgi:hypothetical protein